MAAGGGQSEHKDVNIISDILYGNFQTELFEILLFCSVELVVLLSTMRVICYILCNCNYITLEKEYL